MRSKMALGAGMLVLALAAPVGTAAALEPKLDIALAPGETTPLAADVDVAVAGVRLPTTGNVEVNLNAPVSALTGGSGNVDVRQGSTAALTRVASASASEPARSRPSREALPAAGCCYLGSVNRRERVARGHSRENVRVNRVRASRDGVKRTVDVPARRSGTRDRNHRTAAGHGGGWKSPLSNLAWDRYPDFGEELESPLPDFAPAAATGSLPWKAWLIATLGGLFLVAGLRLRKLSS